MAADPRASACPARCRPSSATRPCSASWAITGRAPWCGRRATAWSPRPAPTRPRPWPSPCSPREPTSSPSLVFMFASTNLVIELGIVLVVLMGWQFAVERVRRRGHHDRPARDARRPLVPGQVVVEARARLSGEAIRGRPARAGRGRGAAARALAREAAVDRAAGPTPPPTPWPISPCSAASWSSATSSPGSWPSSCPVSVWNAVFLHGHGFWTSVENVIVGPFIAIISFVCSIGNVPLAAALWKGGISFGGVVSFIFADLITFPLLLIYRRYYGTRLMLRMLASVLGRDVRRRARHRGHLPRRRPRARTHARPRSRPTTSRGTTRRISISSSWRVRRSLLGVPQPDRLGGGQRAARDPVCGMQVAIANAPASTRPRGRRYSFCSDRCKERFEERWRRRTESRSPAVGTVSLVKAARRAGGASGTAPPHSRASSCAGPPRGDGPSSAWMISWVSGHVESPCG